MRVRSLGAVLASVTLTLFASARAVPPGSLLEDAPADFQDGTRVLAVLSGYYTRDEIVDGGEVLASSCCWFTSSNGHCAWYMARVVRELRGKLHYWFPRSHAPSEATDPNGRGDIVEIELRRTPSGKVAGDLVAVYRQQGDRRDCRVESIHPSAVAGLAAALLNTRTTQGRWLQCDDLKAAGWSERLPPGFPDVTPLSSWSRARARARPRARRRRAACA